MGSLDISVCSLDDTAIKKEMKAKSLLSAQRDVMVVFDFVSSLLGGSRNRVIDTKKLVFSFIYIHNKSSKDRTWSAVPDALLGVIS